MAFGNTYTCSKCGVSFAKTNSHTCDPTKIEAHLLARFEKELDEGRQPYLTPRQQRKLEFYRWCITNDRP